MHKFYFTFGSWEIFPYQNTYLVIVAEDQHAAVRAFRKKYPDRTEGIINCSFVYSETEWEKDCKNNYKGENPAEIIFTDGCYGKKPEGYGELYLFVPEKREIIYIAKGVDDDILQKLQADGFADYLYFEQYTLSCGVRPDYRERVALEKPVEEEYACLADSIPDVLNVAYDGDNLVSCTIMI